MFKFILSYDKILIFQVTINLLCACCLELELPFFSAVPNRMNELRKLDSKIPELDEISLN